MADEVTALRASRMLLRTLAALNLLMAVLLAIGLPASFLLEPALQDYYAERPPLDPERLIPALRVSMALGVPMLAAVHVLLSRLLAIVDTVRTGNPFVPENAARLKSTAWCLLAIQLIGIALGVAAEFLQAGGARVGDWDLSLTGWVAVVLLFVLARVFEQGTRMRTDLETMI